MGITHNQQFYIDLVVAFGLKVGSALCEHVTDVLRDIMVDNNYTVYNCIDDIIGIEASENTDHAL